MKKNVARIVEKIKRLEEMKKELEIAFYAQVGRSILKKINQEGVTIDELKNEINQLKKEWGV